MKHASILSLDDYTLLELFDMFPLQGLLQLGKICQRFKKLSEKSSKSRKQIFLLIDPKKDIDEIGVYHSAKHTACCHLAKFNQTTSDQLAFRFPNITKLVFNFIDSPAEGILDLAYLLIQWSEKLISLKIHIPYDFADNQGGISFPTHVLFDAINQMKTLKHFTFQYYGKICPELPNEQPNTSHSLDLKIFSQLKSFIFYSDDPASMLYPLFELYRSSSSSSNLDQKIIQLHNCIREPEFQFFLNLKPKIRSYFTDISINHPNITIHELNIFCLRYSSLTNLTLCMHYLTIAQITQSLQSLTKLNALRLKLSFPHRATERNDAQQRGEREIEADLELNDPNNVPENITLPLITNITLELQLQTHQNVEMLHLNALFPNLKCLQVYVCECEQCEGSSIQASECYAKLQNYIRLELLKESKTIKNVIVRRCNY